ncbi:Hypothetical predicted protein [Octopus vulgaris]|uniref:Uncharacterized protein n=1 Tax=Octopus vulgaris TaxID=6645 RepID=A0AA36BPD5_OCTVU|nr:Hypothetical predicted protein [Octopus vulgaris]
MRGCGCSGCRCGGRGMLTRRASSIGSEPGDVVVGTGAAGAAIGAVILTRRGSGDIDVATVAAAVVGATVTDDIVGSLISDQRRSLSLPKGIAEKRKGKSDEIHECDESDEK